jgi:hypothetical protein
MEYGRVTPHPLFSSRLRHTHQVSTYFAGGHLMTLSTSRQEGITGRLRNKAFNLRSKMAQT